MKMLLFCEMIAIAISFVVYSLLKYFWPEMLETYAIIIGQAISCLAIVSISKAKTHLDAPLFVVAVSGDILLISLGIQMGIEAHNYGNIGIGFRPFESLVAIDKLSCSVMGIAAIAVFFAAFIISAYIIVKISEHELGKELKKRPIFFSIIVEALSIGSLCLPTAIPTIVGGAILLIMLAFAWRRPAWFQIATATA